MVLGVWLLRLYTYSSFTGNYYPREQILHKCHLCQSTLFQKKLKKTDVEKCDSLENEGLKDNLTSELDDHEVWTWEPWGLNLSTLRSELEHPEVWLDGPEAQMTPLKMNQDELSSLQEGGDFIQWWHALTGKFRLTSCCVSTNRSSSFIQQLRATIGLETTKPTGIFLYQIHCQLQHNHYFPLFWLHLQFGEINPIFVGENLMRLSWGKCIQFLDTSTITWIEGYYFVGKFISVHDGI